MKKVEYEPFCEFAHQLNKDKWEIIQKSLKNDIKDTKDLVKAIQNIYGTEIKELDCTYLIEAIKDHQPKEFFEKTIPFLKNLVLTTDKIFPEKIKKLSSGNTNIYKFTRKEAACILANSFFCCFNRESNEKLWSKSKIPSVNLDEMYGGPSTNQGVQIAKIRMILNYFTRITDNLGKGEISFYREVVKKEDFDITKMDGKLEGIKIFGQGSIHDAYHQDKSVSCVDFANEFIGGAAYSYGSVQEEILFNTNPELLIARLIMERMEDNEAIIMKGAEKFSFNNGYGFTLEFGGDYQDKNFDENGQCLNVDIGIDALDFRGGGKFEQFNKDKIDREILKCFAGFKSCGTSNISTGSWGAGAFEGDKRLKLILQWIGASISKKELFYYTFNNQELAKECQDFTKSLLENKISILQLYNAVQCIEVESKIPNSFTQIKKILKIE